MTKHGSASLRQETPHANNDQTTQSTLSRSIRKRALRIINNNAIDPTTRGFIRYALGINDPWTPSLVRRAESGEIFAEDFSLRASSEDQEIDERLEALTDLICRPGNEPDTKSGALLLLMSTLENSSQPKSLATTAKYLAFMHCCEFSVGGIVDTQVAFAERQLLTHRT
jgi:hypothetical protein